MSKEISDSLKVELMASNQEYRDLVKEHQRYETRLNELASLAFPNEDEKQEQTTLKKKKLQVKDKIESILTSYKRSAVGH